MIILLPHSLSASSFDFSSVWFPCLLPRPHGRGCVPGLPHPRPQPATLWSPEPVCFLLRVSVPAPFTEGAEPWGTQGCGAGTGLGDSEPTRLVVDGAGLLTHWVPVSCRCYPGKPELLTASSRQHPPSPRLGSPIFKLRVVDHSFIQQILMEARSVLRICYTFVLGRETPQLSPPLPHSHTQQSAVSG